MAVKHLSYMHKTTGTEVRGLRVTAKNFVNLAKWSNGMAISRSVILENGEEKFINQRIRVGKLIAQVGDVVVREQIGESEGKPVYKFYRVKADQFDAEYVKN